MRKRERLKGYEAQVSTLQKLNRGLAGEIESYRVCVREPGFLWLSLTAAYLERFLAWNDRAIKWLGKWDR